MRRILFLIVLFVFPLWGAEGLFAQRLNLSLQDWQFSRDGEQWQSVTVPHDWAISGPFDKKWDLQFVAIEQNGEKEKTEKSGRSGALPWIGKGYYKTTITIPKGYDHAVLRFDGAMSEPTVSINGKYAGYWAYGYNAFCIEATPYLYMNGGENTIEVTLQNQEESSRWYPGGGIYRPVTLELTQTAHLDQWQTFIRTTKATSDRAELKFSTTVMGIEHNHDAHIELSLLNPAGKEIINRSLTPDNIGYIESNFTVNTPQLWSPESPSLYTMRIRLYSDRKLQDEVSQKVGIRTISVDESGFKLNGISRKIQGVCLHHDLGPLGAAVNKAAIIRQIRILKDMGCDAIRTSHNMPSTLQMEVCDSMGMMVMAESFDMWIYPKCKNGYARFFRDWADRDITNLVLNHRNHPSIVMWSIGNEIPEQWSVEGREIARHLQNLCHSLDPSRPVTQGMDRADNAIKSGFAQVMDIAGFNYRVHLYDGNIGKLPQKVLLGSETASTVSSRGVYKFPVAISNNSTYPDGQCTGYDTEFCSWSNLPDADFYFQDERKWTMGQFVWTGFDYLGEPTPYDQYWPSRSSYFGICDLAGLPKDRYYLYRSVWNMKSHTLHILPHWTWPGREGEVTPVFVYTDYPEAELFVNGKSMGRQKKSPAPIIDSNMEANAIKDSIESWSLLEHYRLMWRDVKYEKGEIRVVAYDKDGKKAEEKAIRTAGEPSKLSLQVDRPQIVADGNDLAFITVSLTDAKGTLIPDADNEVTVQVTGAGTFRGICNGDATSLEVFTEPHMHLFHGQLVVVCQSAKNAGSMTVTVKSEKMEAKTTIKVGN